MKKQQGLLRKNTAQKKNEFLYFIFLLSIFCIPFFGISIELGATFRPANMLAILGTILLLINYTSNKGRQYCYSFKLVINILFVLSITSVIANIIFILTENIDKHTISYFTSQFGSRNFSFLRIHLKPVQIFVSEWINFSFLLIPISTVNNKIKIVKIVWTYVISVTIQATLGIVQYLIYISLGINIFPILRGGIIGSHIYQQDAAFFLNGIKFIRVNALAGEPKTLALFLCAGIGISVFFLFHNVSTKREKMITTISIFIQLIALMLTFSTLGYICLLAGMIVYTFSIKRKLSAIFAILISFFIILNLISIPFVVSDIFHTRFLERLGFEDMDLIYLSFIQRNPDFLLFGTGYGNFHLAAFQETQEIIPWKFGIVLPKLGVLNLLAQSGIVGLVIFSSLPIMIIRKLNNLARKKYYVDKVLCNSTKYMVIYLSVICLVLRYNSIGLLSLGMGFAIYEISLSNHKKFTEFYLKERSK